MQIENRLYTVAEVATLLRTGQARIRQYARLGVLKHRQHGRRILIIGASIARYLECEMEKEN
jgi:hypothetical protein